MSNYIKQDIFHKGGEFAVLALHGLRGTPQVFDPIIKILKDGGLTIYAPHLLGFGFSETRNCGHWQDWLSEALRHFDFLAAQYKYVAVCGLSVGATLALAVTANRPNVTAISLMSTTLFYDGWGVPWYRFLRHFIFRTPMKNWIGQAEKPPYGIKNPVLRSKVEKIVLSRVKSVGKAAGFPLPAIHEAEKLMHYTRQRLHNITVPTLILHAMEDDSASLKNAYFVKKHISSKITKLVTLNNSYHIITLDYDRTEVGFSTLDFFKEMAA